jgi:hypothetical protein
MQGKITHISVTWTEPTGQGTRRRLYNVLPDDEKIIRAERMEELLDDLSLICQHIQEALDRTADSPPPTGFDQHRPEHQVTGPDKCNTDKRHADDASLRYLNGRTHPRTDAQWLGYFREHYGDTYTITPPSAPGSQWCATALSGPHDQLWGWSAPELLDELIEHRPAKHIG